MLFISPRKIYAVRCSNYIHTPDITNNQWLIRNSGVVNGIVCDKKVLLTEELKLYLLYFNSTAGHNINHTVVTFSNLPIKEV